MTYRGRRAMRMVGSVFPQSRNYPLTSAYFSENREVAVELVRAFADLVVSDGLYPIRDILDKGYEDSFYIDDSMGLDEKFEAIVRTPMIETTTDWDQPFEDHDFRISVQDLFEGI